MEKTYEAHEVINDGVIEVQCFTGTSEVAGAIDNLTDQDIEIEFPFEIGVNAIEIPEHGQVLIPMDPDGIAMVGAFLEGEYTVREQPGMLMDFEIE